MNCPVCNDIELKQNKLHKNLTAFRCSKCSGKWIRLDDYLGWLNTTNKEEFELITNKNVIKNSKRKISNIKANAVGSDFKVNNKSNLSLVNTNYNEDVYIEDDKEEYGSSDQINLSKLKSLCDKVEDSKKAKLCPDCARILIKYKVENKLNFRIENCGTCSGIWLDSNKWEILENCNLNDKIYRFFTLPWQKNLRVNETKTFLEDKYYSKFGKNDFDKVKDIKKWLEGHPSKQELVAFILKTDPYKI